MALRCVATNTSPAKIETCGEQGSRTPRPGRATRVADGHLAPMQDGLSNDRSRAPPPGVEPGPSALQADAQTSYARVGCGGVGVTPPVAATIRLSENPQPAGAVRPDAELSSGVHVTNTAVHGSGRRIRTWNSRFRAARPAS